MILREFIKCLTCGQDITARVSLGKEKRQEHTIICPNCQEEIRFAIDLDFEKVSTKIDYIENCEHNSCEGTVINISPTIPIKKEYLNEDFISPAMLESIKILEENNVYENLQQKDSKYFDMQELLGINYDFLLYWKKVKKMWSLFNNKKFIILERLIPNKKYYQNPVSGKKDFLMVLFMFLTDFTGSIGTFDKIMKYSTNALKKYPDEYAKFLNFVNSELFESCIKDFLSVYQEFFDNYSDFKQVEGYIKSGLVLPDDYNVTSFNFNGTKMFYGNAYENFTKHLDVLTLLFNVASGRSFDTFDQMDYKKYKSLDKAKKADPLKNIPELYEICKAMDSGMRNSSHHADIEFDSTTYNVLYTHGKGNKHTDEISYGEYLKRCYDMMISCNNLLIIMILHRNRYLAYEK